MLSAPPHELHYPWGAAPHPGLPETTARSYCRACAAPLPPATAPAARRPATALSAAPQRTPAPRRQLASVMQAQAHHTITAVAGTASGTRNLSFSASWRQLEPPISAVAPARETAATQPKTCERTNPRHGLVGRQEPLTWRDMMVPMCSHSLWEHIGTIMSRHVRGSWPTM